MKGSPGGVGEGGVVIKMSTVLCTPPPFPFYISLNNAMPPHHMGQDFLCLSCSLGERAPHLFLSGSFPFPGQGRHQRAQNKGKPGLHVASLGTIWRLLAHDQALCSSCFAPRRRYQMLTPAQE